MASTLTLDLFTEPEPTPAPLIEISVQGIEHKSPEQIAHLSLLALAVADSACPAHQRGYSINPHLHAFIAQARHAGLADPALEPIRTDGAGRRLYDEREVARYANELLRGVRSDMPPMTPKRWAEAIQAVREGKG